MDKPEVLSVPAHPNNYSKGRGKSRINRIVIHTQQGTEKGTEAWFKNPLAHVSAHYGVSFEGIISQFVADADTAWHAGNLDYNRCSIGVELEGFMERGYFPATMIGALVMLCAYLCEKYDIPKDRAHIIGHAEVPTLGHPGEFGGAEHHADPGLSFPWASFMMELSPNFVEAERVGTDDQAVS